MMLDKIALSLFLVSSTILNPAEGRIRGETEPRNQRRTLKSTKAPVYGNFQSEEATQVDFTDGTSSKSSKTGNIVSGETEFVAKPGKLWAAGASFQVELPDETLEGQIEMKGKGSKAADISLPGGNDQLEQAVEDVLQQYMEGGAVAGEGLLVSGNNTGDFGNNNTGFSGNGTGIFFGSNNTGDFFDITNSTNSTGVFYGNNTGAFFDITNSTNSTGGGLFGNITMRRFLQEWNSTTQFFNKTNSTNGFYGNQTGAFFDITNSTLGANGTAAYNNSGNFFPGNASLSIAGARRMLSAESVANFKPHFIRVANEAVDFRLNWATADELIGGVEKYFINPSILFVENDDGEVEWVRSVRYHSVQGRSMGIQQYGDQLVHEIVWRYNSAVLLSSEKFMGNMSGGFDDESVMQWGLQTGGPLEIVDSRMLSNEVTKAPWTDLCEAYPNYQPEKRMLTRKEVTGAEDPKLFPLPQGVLGGQASSWALTFSSYPPFQSKGLSSSEECKWSDESVFQMYFVPGAEAMAHGESSPGHRLDCGNPVTNEKNWIAFTYEEELYYVHTVEPHIVMKVTDTEGACEKVFETSHPVLEELKKRVSVRGSATAVRYSDNEYLALLHTHDEYSIDPYTTRAYTFEASPPFRVLRVSKPLELQSSGNAFASSLALHEGKVMVGYGVHDSESRLMVMSVDYLEKQFEGDCGGCIDRLVGDTKETCAEKVISLMLGDVLMPPRRAMETVGNEFSECQRLTEYACKPEMVLKASRHNKAESCSDALSRNANGLTCSARAKWVITNKSLDAEKAFRLVADEFHVCADVVSMECTADDLRWPKETCERNLSNSNDIAVPTVLLSVSHADTGLLQPLVQCSGISTETNSCENDFELALVDSADYVEDCLKEGESHLRSSNSFQTSMLKATAARRAAESKSKLILFVRDPLDVVFDAVADALSRKTSKYGLTTNQAVFEQIARTEAGHAFIIREMKKAAIQSVNDWEVMKTYIENPTHDIMMVTDEELHDKLLQPGILAEISRHVGLTPDRTTILDGIQATETFRRKVVPGALKANDFYLQKSLKRMDFICHLLEEVPAFMESAFEQGYGDRISTLSGFCLGFDEEWLVLAGDTLFLGYSETY